LEKVAPRGAGSRTSPRGLAVVGKSTRGSLTVFDGCDSHWSEYARMR
jgi:hypothetical protein